MLAAASIAGLERTEAFFEPAFESEVAVSWEGGSEQRESFVVPARTPLAVILEAPLSTRTAQAGDRFRARVAAPVRVDGRIVIPKDAEIEGHVSSSDVPGSDSRPGSMQLTYELIRLDGRVYGLNSRSQVYEGAAARRGFAREVDQHMEFDEGATLEFELGQDVAMMRESAALALN